MKKIVLAALLTAMPAFAHVEPGTYKGLTADGKECSMIAGKTYFENNAHHPLNERIDITIGEHQFKVGHPPIFSAKDAVISFNHDAFQGLIPTSKGAVAVEIEMVHSEEFEGPRSFIFVENKWKEKIRESYKCENITLVK